MRNNQPVTDQEYVVPEGITLVSKTDLHGSITECNDAFEAASGFSRSELIGKPHNLVRHPDVPPAVFADMWSSLKRGMPWSQIVKNRRADGGFYWVKANATPIFKNGKITGYMSVRSAVSPADKQAATAAYKDIKSGRAKIEHGKVHYGLNFSKLNFLGRMNPQYQLSLVLLLFFAIPHTIYQTLHDELLEALISSGVVLLISFIYGLSRLKHERQTRASLRQLASNDPVEVEDFDPSTFKGKLQGAIKSASLGAIERIEESAYQLDNAARLQTAIDQVSANVMIADAQLNIIYMNDAMLEFMKERQAQLNTVLPDLNADTIIGSNIDIFHKNPAHNRAMLERIKEPTRTNIEVAGFHLELNVIPVYNRAGQQTSTLVEWLDKTADVQLLEQVGAAVTAAKEGLLNQRIDLSKVDGVAKQLSQSFNDLLDTVESPINSAVDVAVALSDGDLTRHIEGNYMGRFAVMQDSMNVAVDNLASMMLQTRSATTNVGDGAHQIKQGSHELNDRTQDQAASLEQTASSMEEITASVKHNADNAEQAADVTHTTADQAKNGVDVMNNAIDAMQQINESSQKINDIIGLIDSIAFQTNLLALNAAVEAARAGEHGRGFAVVAGEVRNLAGKSSEAAKDIRNLIEDTVKKVSEGTHHVQGSGDALNEIVESISNVNQIIEEIASSSREQSIGVEQINQSITQIDTAVQQNAAMVEETAATAEELSGMSSMMTNNVSQFKLDAHSLGLDKGLQTGNFDFAAARRAHNQWRVKVRAYINDVDIEFDRNTATDPTKCALGTWLYGSGSQYASLSSYSALEMAHSELHSFIGSILDLKDIGDTESANHKMAQLKEKSHAVMDMITQLENEITSGNHNASIINSVIIHHDEKEPSHSTDETKKLSAPAAKPVVESKPIEAKPPVVKPVTIEAKAPAKASTPALEKPTESSSLQTPAPAQPVTHNEDEWAEF